MNLTTDEKNHILWNIGGLFGFGISHNDPYIIQLGWQMIKHIQHHSEYDQIAWGWVAEAAERHTLFRKAFQEAFRKTTPPSLAPEPPHFNFDKPVPKHVVEEAGAWVGYHMGHLQTRLKEVS